MTKRICDKCGSLINDDNTRKNSVYQFSIDRDSYVRIENETYLQMKQIDLCFSCASKAIIAFEKYLLTK